jgi:hypothetical protein
MGLPSFKKYKNDYYLVAGVLLVGIIAVMGQHWAGIAKTKFWWTFWDAMTVIAIVGWVAGWIYLRAKDKRRY